MPTLFEPRSRPYRRSTLELRADRKVHDEMVCRVVRSRVAVPASACVARHVHTRRCANLARVVRDSGVGGHASKSFRPLIASYFTVVALYSTCAGRLQRECMKSTQTCSFFTFVHLEGSILSEPNECEKSRSFTCRDASDQVRQAQRRISRGHRAASTRRDAARSCHAATSAYSRRSSASGLGAAMFHSGRDSAL